MLTHPSPVGRLSRLLPLLALLVAAPLPAQPMAGGPGYEPLNPDLVARSPLGAGTWRDRAAGWTVGGQVEYGSAVERNLNWPGFYLLDAELLRLEVRARRDLGERLFVEARGGVTGAHAGFADGFFDAFHDLIGWVMAERDTRPRNVYGDRLMMPHAGVDRAREARLLSPSDIRLDVGWRASDALQPALLLTLPTAPSRSVFHRGVATIGVSSPVRVPLTANVLLDGSMGFAYAPRTGELAGVQRTRFGAVSGGPRIALRDGSAVYASLFYHSAAYRGTGFPELDRPEVTLDVGYDWRRPSGRRWRISVVEDLRRRDPGIDLILRIAVQ